MQGFLKSAGVFHQCPRCFSLRQPDGEVCLFCLDKLQVMSTDSQPLSLSAVSFDDYTEVKSVLDMRAKSANA